MAVLRQWYLGCVLAWTRAMADELLGKKYKLIGDFLTSYVLFCPLNYLHRLLRAFYYYHDVST